MIAKTREGLNVIRACMQVLMSGALKRKAATLWSSALIVALNAGVKKYP